MKQRKIRSPFSTFSSFLNEHNDILKESFIALLICACGDLIAGIVLGKMNIFLETFPGLLVLIPGAIGMRGNIFGSFASRLSTALHIGIIDPKFNRSEELINNIFSSFVLTLCLSLFLAIIAKIICFIFGFKAMSLVDFILISLIAGIISVGIMLPVTMFISFRSFKHGWDPDNVTTPLVAAVGDLFTLPAIVISIFIISALKSVLYLEQIVFIIIIPIVLLSLVHCYNSSQENKTIIKQSTPVLIVCSILGVSAGGILNSSLETLLKNPSLLTLVPLFSGESGGLVSILSARLSSGIHYGLIEPLKKPEGESIHNFIIILLLTLVMYPFIGILAESSSIVLHLIGIGFDKIILISSIAGFILIPIMMILVYYISIISYNKGYDPDNILIPISTSVTDSISSLILISVSLIITGAIFI
ncbi:magnesium transporter [uncultured Methanobrevibacter sp.]|uniref:magnesium transporter n=1 Tax=uncultured Methanobrevibacter sp. TaxID=253161 RepID=UPI00263662AC|nr:magnesium transporter [uncultured Methanobrevibacter sp.]